MNRRKARTGRFLIPRVYGLLVLLLGGCSVRPPTQVVTASSQSVPAALCFAPGPSIGLFEVQDAQTGEPAGLEQRAATHADQDGRWETTTVLGDAPPRQAGYRLLDDGSVALEWTRSVKDTDPGGPARLYVFDPPLVMAPGVLKPGEVFQAESRMTERDPRDEARVVLSGRAQRRAWIDAPGQPPRPFGEVDRGQAVHGVLRIEVGPAVALRQTVQLVGTPGRDGEEVVDYSITVLGLRFKHERTRYVPKTPEPADVSDQRPAG